MARKRSKTVTQEKEKVEWKGYVAYTLPVEMKKQFKGWVENNDIWGNVIPTLLDGDFKISLSYDAYNQAHTGALYCKSLTSGNGGYCLTARGGDPETALYKVLFVHYFCMEEEWVDHALTHDDEW